MHYFSGLAFKFSIRAFCYLPLLDQVFQESSFSPERHNLFSDHHHPEVVLPGEVFLNEEAVAARGLVGSKFPEDFLPFPGIPYQEDLAALVSVVTFDHERGLRERNLCGPGVGPEGADPRHTDGVRMRQAEGPEKENLADLSRKGEAQIVVRKDAFSQTAGEEIKLRGYGLREDNGLRLLKGRKDLRREPGELKEVHLPFDPGVERDRFNAHVFNVTRNAPNTAPQKNLREEAPVQAVILAAGLGSRLGLDRTGYPKGLLRVAGRELLLRHLILLSRYGVTEFVLVVNPRNRPHFEAFLARHPGYRVTLVENPFPERGNGYSLWCARLAVKGPFVLTMSDHLYEENFVARALSGRGLVLDREGRYVEPAEATKVRLRDDRVEAIGKDLTEFDGFDTGFFILDPEIFEAAGRVVTRQEEVSLSEIVREAALPVTEVSGLFWTDVDTPQDLRRAERELVRASVKGSGDGWISRHLNRPLSTRLSPHLCGRLSPNQATILSFLLGLLSALVAWFNTALGGFLYQLHSVLDGVDGEIARATLQQSRFGGLLDSVLDRYVDFLFLAVLLLKVRPEGPDLLVALMALLGTVMVSYVTERFKGAYGREAYTTFPVLHYFPGKRDERIFLIFIFCLLGWLEPLFPVLAFLTQGKVLFTLAVFWKGRRRLET